MSDDVIPRRYRHQLSCGCERVTSEELLRGSVRCDVHDAFVLVVGVTVHEWRGMRRVDVERRAD